MFYSWIVMDRRVDQCVNVWHLVNNWKWPCSLFWRKCSVCHVSVFHLYSSNGLLITLNYPSSPIWHDMEPAIVGIGRGSRQSWVGYYSIMSSDFMSSSSLCDALSVPLGLLNGEDVHGFLSDWEWDTHTALSQKKPLSSGTIKHDHQTRSVHSCSTIRSVH